MAAHDLELVALGRAIHRLRHDRRLSIASLASKAGVSPKHLNRIELGQTNPAFMTPHARHGPGRHGLEPHARRQRRDGAMTEERELIAFGRAVRQVREERGVSVDALATAADIASTDVKAIEAGRLDPRLPRRAAPTRRAWHHLDRAAAARRGVRLRAGGRGVNCPAT